MAPGLIDSILNGITGNGPTSNPSPAGGILGLPTLSLPTLSLPGASIPGVPSISLPTPSLPTSPSASPSLPLTSSSASPSSSSLPTSSPSLPPTSSATRTSSPTSPVVAGDGDAAQTITNSITVTDPGASPSGSPVVHAATKSFLQNKPLAGAVFAVVGLIVLVFIVIAATFFVRRRRQNRLLDDAISFDPALLAAAERYDGASEKGYSQSHASHPSVGGMSAGSSRPMPGPGYGATYGGAPLPPLPQSEYYGHQPQQAYSGQGAEYYGGARQPNYAYTPPMADAPAPSTLAGTSWTSQAPPQQQQQQHNIPRVPVPPVADPLPEEFGSAQDRRTSADEAAFWARTLTVRNE